MDRVRSLAGFPRLRAPAALACVLLAGFAFVVYYVLQIQQYFVQPDELEYVKQAIQIGHQLHPIMPHERGFTSWSQLQPVLMAPAWTLLSAETAFKVQHIVNAAVMVSAAIPAYLLARRVTGARWAAAFVALFTVMVPWVSISATMMTEAAAYPAFLWAVLGLQNAVARPSWRNDVLGLAGIALALFARPQFAVLAPVLILATIAQLLRFPPTRDWRLRQPRWRAAVAAHPVLIVVTLVGIAGVAFNVVGSHQGVLGSYSIAASGSLLAPGWFAFGREALSYVAIAVGVLPLSFSLAWIMATILRPASAERHAYAWISLLAGLGLLAAVGSFSVRFTGGVNSRYVFYLAPLMMVGTLALLTERRRLPFALLAGAALAAWLVHKAQLALRGPSLVSPESAFHDVLFGRVGLIESDLGLRNFPPPRVIAAVSLLFVLAFVVARWRRRDRWALATALAAIALWCAAETGYAMHRIIATQKGVSPEFVAQRSWIDRTLPAGAKAPMLISDFGDPASAQAVWWDTAFWNKKIDRTLQNPSNSNLEQAFPEQFWPQGDGSIQGFSTSLIPGSDQRPSPYLIRSSVDRRFGFRGLRVLAEQSGVQITTLPQPVQLDWSLTAPSDTGLLLAGSTAELLVFAGPAEPATFQHVAIDVTAAPGAERPGRLRIIGPGVRVQAAAPLDRTRTIRFKVPGRAVNTRLTLISAGTPSTAGEPAVGVQIQAIRTSE
jgi:hypothetical protein